MLLIPKMPAYGKSCIHVSKINAISLPDNTNLASSIEIGKIIIIFYRI